MLKSELVAIREFVPDDVNFIYASWLRGLYYGDSWYSLTKKQTFMENYHKVIQFLLSKPTTSVRIACLKEDPNVILGYAVLSPTALHWTFVKKEWRHIGIARDLIPAHIKTATHLTKTGLSIVKKKEWEFNPFKLEE